MMASRIVFRRTLMGARLSGVAVTKQARILPSAGRRYQRSTNLYYATTAQTQSMTSKDPIAASMEQSTTPTGTNATSTEDEAKHAAFLGEADSDDAHEADREANPDKYDHKLVDVNVSGLHGQAGEGDESIERERKLEALDASQSAYLGEGDSDDAHEADREINPEKYRHHIADASQAAYLGEADSDDAHEGDREVNPEKYRHHIEDPQTSGMHGESGEGDEPLERV